MRLRIIRHGVVWVSNRVYQLPIIVYYKKGALYSQLQMIKFNSCLPMVGGSLDTPASSTTKTGRHDVAEILLNVALNTINQINQQIKPTVLHK